MFLDSMISRIFGCVAGFKFPKLIQKCINNCYASYFKIDMSEFWRADTYESLNALFTREFIKQREIDKAQNTFISPCDGVCLTLGSSSGDSAFSIKGSEYRLSELLGGAMSDYEINAGYDFANIYLSPKDYHHYHAPCDLLIKRAIHIPGRLFSVSPKALKKIDSLYTKNERVVLECQTNENKKIWLVFVGALNVGKMNFAFDRRIKTNAKANQMQTYNYDELSVKKGERLGNFELGSTIVIVSQNDTIKYGIKDGEEIKFGKSIGYINL